MAGWVKQRNLHPSLKWNMEQSGLLPSVAAKKLMVYRDSAQAPYAYWHKADGRADQLYSTIATAYAATVSGRNDVILLTPEYHQLLETLTYANNATHLIGMEAGYPVGFHYPRFGQSANFTPVVDWTGSWNTWSNVRFAHGRGHAGNLIGLNLDGHYNNLTGVHFYSPGNATEGDVDSDTLYTLSLAGQDNYFERCTLGIDTVARSAANGLVKINDYGVRNVFKDCLFLMFQDASTPYFIYVASGALVQNRWTLFDNCTFIAYSANWATSLTVAIKYQYSGQTGQRLLFNNCCFFGVTDLIADGYEDNCQFFTHSSTAGTGVGLPHVPQT